MGAIEVLLAGLHDDIQQDYNFDQVGDFRNCETIARSVCELLRRSGHNPHKVLITNTQGTLEPLLFPGKEWGCHVVACSGDMAFDPLVGHPIKLSEYLSAAFKPSYTIRIRYWYGC